MMTIEQYVRLIFLILLLLVIAYVLVRAVQHKSASPRFPPKRIEQSITEVDILTSLQNIESHLAVLASCVRNRHHEHGDQHSLSTKHWND